MSDTLEVSGAIDTGYTKSEINAMLLLKENKFISSGPILKNSNFIKNT